MPHREYAKARKRTLRRDKKYTYAELVEYDDLKWEHTKPKVTTVESRREVAAVAKRKAAPGVYTQIPKFEKPPVLEASYLSLLRPLVPVIKKGFEFATGKVIPKVGAGLHGVGKATTKPPFQPAAAAATKFKRTTSAKSYMYGGDRTQRGVVAGGTNWGKILPIVATGAIAGATDVIIDQLLPQMGLGGDRPLAIPDKGVSIMPGGVPATYAPFNPDLIVSSWTTGTAKFYRLMTGEIAVQKKNGVWKVYRPYRPVVVPRKWDARAMSRVATALKRQRKTATKVLQLTGGVPKKTTRALAPRRAMRALPSGGTNIVVD